MTQPSGTHATSGRSRSPVAAHPVTSAIIAILVLASIFFALYVPLYASATPKVGDFPFFYFYLLIYMPVLGRGDVDRHHAAAQSCGPGLAPRARRTPATVRWPDEQRQRRHLHHRRRPVPRRHADRLRGRALAPGRGHAAPERVGPGRAQLRHLRLLVPARRRPLHRLHLHRRARRDVRRRRGDGLLRGGVHDHRVPDRADLPAQAVVDRPGAPLRHPGRLHPRPVRVARPRAGHRLHRHPRADALHRAAAGGHPGRAHGDGRRHHVGQRLRQGPAAVHRVPGARDLHLRLRASGPRADRLHQGHPGLPDGHRGGPLPADQGGRLGAHLRGRRGPPEDDQPGHAQADRRVHPHLRATASSRSPPWRSARRWP